MPVSRKLLIRIVGAPLLLAALGFVLYVGHRSQLRGLPNTPLVLLLALVWVLCLHEIETMCRVRGIAMPRLVGLSVVAVLLARLIRAGAGLPDAQDFAAGAGILLFLLLLLLVFRYGQMTPEAAGLAFLGYGYVSLLEFLVIPPVPAATSTFYLLFLLACSKGSDMAAFVVGKSIGRHKMAPVVSPHKTWEGGIGGGIAGTAAGFAVIWFTPLRPATATVPVPALLGLALSVTIAAQVGDLVKSAFKRWAGVKDSGRLLPEFGGMLDMVDSFLVAGPVAHFATNLLLRAFA